MRSVFNRVVVSATCELLSYALIISWSVDSVEKHVGGRECFFTLRAVAIDSDLII